MHKLTKSIFALALMSTLAACSPQPDESEAVSMTVDEAFATITREAMETHLNFLADDALLGRMTGSEGYDKAADYVAKQFESLGLEPGGDDGWFQQVPFITNLIDVEKSGVTMHLDSGDAGLKWKDDYVMNGDPVRSEISVRAEVVYAGYGIHAPDAGYSDYDGIDVEGKIVAIFSGAPATFSHNERAF